MAGPSAALNPGKRTVMTILAKAMMMMILLIKRLALMNIISLGKRETTGS